jgi:nitroreductase
MFHDLVKARYSCRNYINKPVEEEKILKVLEAGRVAPSAVNKQPWTFFVIRDEANRLKVLEAYNREWIKPAPIIIVACGNHDAVWKRADGKDHLDIDIAIAVDHMILQATELGLGTCWVCNFNAEMLKNVLNLPQNIEPIVIIPMGYPGDIAQPERHINARKPLSDIVKWEI